MAESPHLQLIRDYFSAIERRASFAEIASFLAPDIIQHEFPNRFVPKGATRGLKELQEASERGRKVVLSERYEILNAVEEGPRLALEVQWTGILTIDAGALKAGEPMRARFGVFFEIVDSRIRRQHNYDCFDPF